LLETLRMTLAMSLGLTDHISTIGELIAAVLEPTDVPPLPKEAETTLGTGTRRFRLIVGRGGRGTNKPVPAQNSISCEIVVCGEYGAMKPPS
jgi:hypothetical protein